ncbi:MAG: ribosome recycling factor [Actinobacteria bacterium]|nr:ribosome recycling factor [Actinomycetota bacterium]MCL5447069.1 ribosome recycling factor [Actinomycetota bacterium]
MNEEIIDVAIEEAREKMVKAVSHVKSELAGIRTGRATPGLVEHLKVDLYGSEVELRQLAGMSVPEARQLVISPYDKGSIVAIEKAILGSGLGVTPASDGQVIRLSFPPLTEERRKELVKVVRQKTEDGRVAIRNLRRQARHDLEALEHGSEISSDELERAEREMDKATHSAISEMDGLLARKEAELMEV